MASLEQEIQQSNFASEQVKANLNVLFTAHCLSNRISAFLKPKRLTHEQFNVLRILRGSHPKSMCQKDILRRMIAPSSNVTLIIKKLKDKQWVSVLQSELDKREYVINITQFGLDILSEMDRIFEQEKGNLLNLTEQEARELNRLLDKMRD